MTQPSSCSRYIAWYIPYGIYHGIYHTIYHFWMIYIIWYIPYGIYQLLHGIYHPKVVYTMGPPSRCRRLVVGWGDPLPLDDTSGFKLRRRWTHPRRMVQAKWLSGLKWITVTDFAIRVETAGSTESPTRVRGEFFPRAELLVSTLIIPRDDNFRAVFFVRDLVFMCPYTNATSRANIY